MSAQGIRAGRAYVEMGTEDSRFVAGLKSAQKRLDSFAKNMAKIGAGVGAVGTSIVAPIVGAAFQFQATGDELAKMSQRTGMTAEALSELRHAAGQSDLAFEDMGKAVTKSQQLIDGAMSGNQGNIDKLAKLGLTAESLAGMTPDQQLEVFADRLAAIDDPATRASRAIEIFGEDGRKMLPMLAGGAAGIADLRAEARALGLQMSTEDANAAASLGDAWSRLTKSANMIVTRIGGAVAPALQYVMDLITPLASAVSKWVDQNRSLVVTVLAVGATLMGVGAALITVAGLAAGLSMAIGGAMTAGTMLMTVLGGIASVLGFIASPIGIVSALLVAGAAYWLMYTESGQATLNWFSTTFGSLTNIAKSTMDGVFNAIKGGNLALAAEIAFTGVKLAIATILESVLKLFGSSIKDMLKMLADVTKKIGGVIGSINEARQAMVNFLAEQIGNAMGVDTSIEREDAERRARQFTEGMNNLDPEKMAREWGKELDVEGLKQKLEKLNQQALEGNKPDPDKPTPTFDFDFDGMRDRLMKSLDRGSSVAAVGTFSGQQVSMMGFAEDLQRLQLNEAKESNRKLGEIARKQQVVT